MQVDLRPPGRSLRSFGGALLEGVARKHGFGEILIELHVDDLEIDLFVLLLVVDRPLLSQPVPTDFLHFGRYKLPGKLSLVIVSFDHRRGVFFLGNQHYRPRESRVCARLQRSLDPVNRLSAILFLTNQLVIIFLRLAAHELLQRKSEQRLFIRRTSRGEETAAALRVARGFNLARRAYIDQRIAVTLLRRSDEVDQVVLSPIGLLFSIDCQLYGFRLATVLCLYCCVQRRGAIVTPVRRLVSGDYIGNRGRSCARGRFDGRLDRPVLVYGSPGARCYKYYCDRQPRYLSGATAARSFAPVLRLHSFSAFRCIY